MPPGGPVGPAPADPGAKSPLKGPRTAVPPSSPEAPSAPADQYLGKPGSASGPPLAKLGLVGDADLVLTAGGALAFADGRLANDLSAITRAGLNAQGNVFARVTDPAVLRSAAAALVAQHGAFLREGKDLTEQLDLRQGRACALRLLEDLALRAGELKNPKLQGELTALLVRTAAQEPHRPLKDFTYAELDLQADAKKLPRSSTASEAVYPSRPDYDRWLKDGKIGVHVVCDNDATKVEDFATFLQQTYGSKLTRRTEKDGSTTLKVPASGGRPALEFWVDAPKVMRDNTGRNMKPPLFHRINDPKVDVVLYLGHAEYNQRVEYALAHGVSGTGAGKAILLFECEGEGDIESVNRAFPDAHLISTTETTTNAVDWGALTRLFEGFRDRESYEALGKGVQRAITDTLLKSTDPRERAYSAKDHYFFPNTRAPFRTKLDRDTDGQVDSRDRAFHVVRPKVTDAVGGFEAVDQPIPATSLGGEALTIAAKRLSLVLEYSQMLPPDQQRRLPWGSDAPVADGFFTPPAGNLSAFQFTEAGGKLRIRLSTRFAHTPAPDLERMLAVEAGLWYGQRAGLDATGRSAFALSMLERVAHQQLRADAPPVVTAEPWAREELLLERYGLAATSFAELKAATGNPDEFAPAHFQKLRELVAGKKSLAVAPLSSPRPVSEPVPVPSGLVLERRQLSPETLDLVRAKMGLPGRVVRVAPDYLGAKDSGQVAMAIASGDGRQETITLAVDASGAVRSASRLSFDGARARRVAAEGFVQTLAEDTDRPLGDLMAAFTKALDAGKDPLDAAGEAVIAARRLARPGLTFRVALDDLERPAAWGVIPSGDLDGLRELAKSVSHDDKMAGAENLFLEWACDHQKPSNRTAVFKAWAEQLAASPGETGRANAVAAVLALLPRPLPREAVASVPLDGLFASGLFAATNRDAVVDRFVQAGGLAKADGNRLRKKLETKGPS